MVLLTEDAVEFLGVLDFEVVGGFVFEDEFVATEEAFAVDGVGFPLRQCLFSLALHVIPVLQKFWNGLYRNGELLRAG